MLVIATEAVLPKLRGRLAVYMLEIRAGLYVADLSVRVRELLIAQVCAGLGDGSAIVAWSTNNEAGFEFLTFGPNRRIPTAIDGFQLVSFSQPPETA